MPKVQEFTIRFTTDDTKKCEWVWEAMRTGSEFHGIKVSAMSDGDLFARESILEEMLTLLESGSSLLSDEDNDKMDELEKQKEATWNREVDSENVG